MNARTTILVLALTSGFVACKPRLQGTESAPSGEVASRLSPTLKPKYEFLQPVRAGEMVRAALFFTYDRDPSAGSSRDSRPAQEMAALRDRMKLRTLTQCPVISGNKENRDFAVSGFDLVCRWLLGSAQQRGFMASVEAMTLRSDGNSYHEIEFTGTSGRLGGGKGLVPWLVTLVVAPVDMAAPIFGRSVATSHIALLNGHFYGQDLRRAEAGESGFDFNVSPLMVSEIYGPAIDQFRAHVRSASGIPYRIVGFNGCYSEQIEDYLMNAANVEGADNLDIIANRGRSNYRYFPRQIMGFMTGLQRGDMWAPLISNFKTSQDFQGRGPAIPVFRNKTVGVRTAPARG